jgi:hypothetical protein
MNSMIQTAKWNNDDNVRHERRIQWKYRKPEKIKLKLGMKSSLNETKIQLKASSADWIKWKTEY